MDVWNGGLIMPILAKRPAVYSRATIVTVDGPTAVTVMHDGQPNSINAIAQYADPAVGDRVLTLSLGRTIYVTGKVS